MKTMQKNVSAEDTLAVHGGKAAISGFLGRPRPKVGTDEFMALAELWGYSAETLAAIRTAAAAEEIVSPLLTRYYNPRPSRVQRLEQYACRLFGSGYALAVNSGTSALNAAYAAVGIGPGMEVIVPGYTFFATAAAVVSSKAIPVIAEVNDSLTIDPEDVERKITPRTKAIVVVHMSGNCCDMDAVMDIARRHDLVVIEDNAQACGGTYKGRYLGTIGTMGCFSLSSYKITGAGEGGLVLTDDEWLYTRAQNQHDTAACWRPDRYASERQAGELFCGQNYRMSELEGAVNYVQLKKAKAQARRYNTNMRRITDNLDEFTSTTLRTSNDVEGDVGYQLILLAENGDQAETIMDALRAEGVPAHGRGSKTARDWHLYAYWEHILEQKTTTSEGCPFTCPVYKAQLPRYSKDMCPRTMDLLGRAMFIGVDQWWNAADCRNVARAVNKVCHALG